MNDIGYDLYGRSRYSIRGSMPENVMNVCASKGIELRQAESSEGHCIRVWVYEKDAVEFERTAKECMCFVNAEDKRGGRKILFFIKKHVFATAFALFFAACLILSSLFIWDVKVVGNGKLTEGEIKRALDECGIRPGCFWMNVNNDMIRAEMLIRIPELAWMSVNVNGSKASVPVLERKIPDEIYNEKGYSNLMANCDGIIERVYIRNGNAIVSRGQTVEKGDILALGELVSTYGKTEYVRSLGEVYAHTWREYTSVCPTATLEKKKILKSEKRYAVMLGKRRINFYRGSKNTVDEYDKIIHNNKLGIRDIFTFPVTIVTEKFITYSSAEVENNDVETMKSALKSMAETAEGTLSFGFVSEVRDNLKKVTMRTECIENIAEEKSHEGIIQNDRTDSQS